MKRETKKDFYHCYLDLRRLAERSCLSIRFLRGRTKGENPIPHHRVGQKIFVYWPEFVEWMSGYRAPETSAQIDAEVKEKVDKIINDLI